MHLKEKNTEMNFIKIGEESVKSMYKCAIFDLDGTLCDTLDTISYFANKSLTVNGFEAYGKEKYKYMVGDGAKKLVTRMLENQNAYTKDNFEKVYNDYNNLYDNDFLYLTKPYNGIAELLSFMKKVGMKIGAVSNKPHFAAVSVLENIFEKGLLDDYVGKRENIPLKPDPYSVKEMLEKWKINPKECIYIGDTGVDMQTGKNAGTFTVGVLWGFREEKELKENGADLTVKKPKEIESFLREVNV